MPPSLSSSTDIPTLVQPLNFHMSEDVINRYFSTLFSLRLNRSTAINAPNAQCQARSWAETVDSVRFFNLFFDQADAHPHVDPKACTKLSGWGDDAEYVTGLPPEW